MFKRKQDYYFMFSLIFIIIFSGYLAYDLIQKRNLNLYLDLIHDSLEELITDEKELVSFEKFYDDLVENIKNDSLSSDELEQFAENVIELKLEKEKIDSQDIARLLPQKLKTDSLPILNSSIIPKIARSDWLVLAEEFQKENAISDSIRKDKQIRVDAQNEIEVQIQSQENLSTEFRQRSNQAIEFYEDKKIELESIGRDEKVLLTQIEEELLAELERVKKDNLKIKMKLNSIISLEHILAYERDKLKTHLAEVDSTTIE